MPEVSTYYLEMISPPPREPGLADSGLSIRESTEPCCALHRSFYRLVGGPWQWTDRLSWTDAQWQTHAEDSHTRTWFAYFENTPAGYYELQQQEDGNVEILYFGLAPDFIGKGFGTSFLLHALQSAWEWKGTRRVWVHTCSLDHPGALQNYKNRGMRVYRETVSS